MDGCEHLFRGRWSRGEGEAIRVVVCVKLVQDGVLRGGGGGRGEGECWSGGRRGGTVYAACSCVCLGEGGEVRGGGCDGR